MILGIYLDYCGEHLASTTVVGLFFWLQWYRYRHPSDSLGFRLKRARFEQFAKDRVFSVCSWITKDNTDSEVSRNPMLGYLSSWQLRVPLAPA